MHLLNISIGGLSAVATDPPLLPSGSAGALAAGVGSTAGSMVTLAGTRDAAVADLPNIASSVNELAAAAAGLSGGSTNSAASLAAQQITLPPLPQMPPTPPDPPVEPPDNGKSNVVLQDSDDDASLIH
jgi:hypothetical protein